MEKFDARNLRTDAQQEIRYQVIRLKKRVTSDLKSVILIRQLNSRLLVSISNLWQIGKSCKKNLKNQKKYNLYRISRAHTG